jgi:hypothetical protein
MVVIKKVDRLNGGQDVNSYRQKKNFSWKLSYALRFTLLEKYTQSQNHHEVLPLLQQIISNA